MAAMGWIVVFALGCVAQSLIGSDHLFWGLMLALVSASAGFWLLYSQQAFPTPTKPKHFSFECDVFWIPSALAILCVLGSSWLVWSSTAQSSNPPNYLTGALSLWLIFLLLCAISPGVCGWRMARHQTQTFWLTLAGLIIVSLTLGLYRLTEVPYTVHGDEGMVGIHARELLKGNVATFFSTSWYSIPQFFYFVPACGLYGFGDNLFGLRMSTVIVGTLTVIPLFLVTRAMWGGLAAMVSCLLLIANHWFLHLMHCGVNYVQAAFFATALFCVWYFAHQSKRLSLIVLAGLILGIALMSYQANHLLPFLWIASQIWLWILREIDWRWVLLSTLIPLALAFLTILPLQSNQSVLQSQKGMFQARAEGVVAWTEHNLNHMNYAYNAQGNWDKVWRMQTQRALLSPIAYSDTSIQYNGTMPFLDRWTAVLFLFGVVFAAYRFFDPKWSVPLGWILGILIAGGILTVDPPFYPRLAGNTALFYVLAGGVISKWLLLRKSNSKKTSWMSTAMIYGPMCFVTVAAISIHLHYYFQTYANEITQKSIHYSQTRLAYFMKEHEPGTTFYVMPGQHFSSQSGTVIFLADEYQTVDIDAPPPSFPQTKEILILHASHRNQVAQYRHKYPSLEFETHSMVNGVELFYTFR